MSIVTSIINLAHIYAGILFRYFKCISLSIKHNAEKVSAHTTLLHIYQPLAIMQFINVVTGVFILLSLTVPVSPYYLCHFSSHARIRYSQQMLLLDFLRLYIIFPLMPTFCVPHLFPQI